MLPRVWGKGSQLGEGERRRETNQKTVVPVPVRGDGAEERLGHWRWEGSCVTRFEDTEQPSLLLPCELGKRRTDVNGRSHWSVGESWGAGGAGVHCPKI